MKRVFRWVTFPFRFAWHYAVALWQLLWLITAAVAVWGVAVRIPGQKVKWIWLIMVIVLMGAAIAAREEAR